MSIPENIRSTINQIKESEHYWKAWYFTWSPSYQLEKYKDTEDWKKPYTVSIPYSKYQKHTFPTMKKCYEILQSRDGEIALNHTITIMSLLEKLSKEMYFHINRKWINFNNTKELVIFLLEQNKFLHEDELREFMLLAETRNCVIHHGSRANKKYLKAIHMAKPEYKEHPDYAENYKLGGKICSSLLWVEAWHELLLKITERIERWLNENQ